MLTAQYTDALNKALLRAGSIAKERRHKQIERVHLAYSLLTTQESGSESTSECQTRSGPRRTIFQSVVTQAGGFPEKLTRVLKALLDKEPTADVHSQETPLMSSDCAIVMRLAARQLEPGQDLIAIDHAIQVLVQFHEIHDALKQSGIPNRDSIRSTILEIRSTHCLDRSGKATFASENSTNTAGISTDSANTTSNINSDSKSILVFDDRGNPPSYPVGYEDETREIIQVFSRRKRKTPIIVGNSEMTNRLIMDVLASFISKSKVPTELRRSEILYVRKGFLQGKVGDLDKQCNYIYESVNSFDKPVILYIDIPCRYMKVGSGSTVDIIKLLEPVLGTEGTRCIFTTTPDEFNEVFSSDDRFYPVLTAQPSILETVSIIRFIRKDLEATNKVNIRDAAIIAAANLATHFLPEQPLPDCAVDVIEEAAAAATMELHCGTKEAAASEKQIRQLEMEIYSLQCDGSSTDSLRAVLCGKMAATRKEILKQHEEKKKLGQSIQDVEQKLESLMQLLEKRKRDGDLQIALDLEYYAIPETRDRLSSLRKQYTEKYQSADSQPRHEGEAWFPAAVTSETIHDIVSKRTRIEISVLKATNKSGALDMSYRRSTSSCSVASALLTHNDYLIGWICPLAVEMAAAQLMLTKLHLPLKSPENDPNQYILGSIGKHNVVITCLPHGVPGSTSATVVAERMHATFRSVKYILLVGIGGGVPDQTDVRLGDVVVSQQIIQYDYGKAMANGKFERIGQLAKPAPALLSAMSRIETNHLSDPSHISKIVGELVFRNPIFAFPGASEDVLFDALYGHGSEMPDCSQCDAERLVARSPRNHDGPYVHYGIIATGNQVIKDGQKRMDLAKELGILCFEMEAAGLMDHFRCLVIRGISDYSDSHKNNRWQGYASITAAVYAKDLISSLEVL